MEKSDVNKIVAAILAASKCGEKNSTKKFLSTYDEFLAEIVKREKAK
jgi:hypothetical protein